VLRAGITFRYSEAGPEGLLAGKRAVVILSRGGLLYSEGPDSAMDFQEPHLDALLRFIGIDDIAFVRAERLGFGPDARAAAIAGAEQEIDLALGGAWRRGVNLSPRRRPRVALPGGSRPTPP